MQEVIHIFTSRPAKQLHGPAIARVVGPKPKYRMPDESMQLKRQANELIGKQRGGKGGGIRDVQEGDCTLLQEISTE
jgi:hypothetical protein